MKKGPLILLVLLALAFAAGLLHLFNLRFEAGDVYPPYSSLRADPLGAKALHDSLNSLLEVERNFSSLARLADGRNTALFYLGSSTADARFSTNQYRVFDRFLRTGGRLVLAFLPEYDPPRSARVRSNLQGPRPASPATGTNQWAPPSSPPPSRRRPGRQSEDASLVSIWQRWQAEMAYAALPRDSIRDPYQAVPASRRMAGPLPERLQVHTALCFQRLDPEWTVIYSRAEGTNDWPVVIERQFGNGSLVLAADAYPFSNEALRRERQSQLLTWFIGGRGQVIFEETHLGTRGDPGLVTMARRYRLHGLGLGLILLAGLAIWRSASRFVPPPADELSAESTHQVEGKDSSEGLIHLLRRNIAPVDLLAICVQEWKHSLGVGAKPSPAKIAEMEKLIVEHNALEPRRRQPLETYRRFCAILSKRT
jgi:hypothetical protein